MLIWGYPNAFWVKRRDWSLQTLCNSQRTRGDPEQHPPPGPRDCLALLPPRPWAHYAVWVPSWWSWLVGKRQRAVAVGALGSLSALGKLCVLGSKIKGSPGGFWGRRGPPKVSHPGESNLWCSHDLRGRKGTWSSAHWPLRPLPGQVACHQGQLLM